ncbi:MAG: glycosyltransferase family 39 protein [Pyrinomonadaceae bacterium]|nr:glycosyltransferase family 39 protein [Pyrinomonadaceae bacterium]
MTRTTSNAELNEREAAQGFRRSWRWWLPPSLLSLALALLYLDPFIGDWDALDYTILSLRGAPSSMALGRSLFIFTNYALWRAAHALFNLPAADAYLLFKGAVVLVSALAIIACWRLALEVTASERSATVAAILIALSPSYIVYSGQVMTEIPSLLLLAIALTVYLRGVKRERLWMMLAGAAILGADVNVRETVGFYAPWLVIAPLACGWKIGRKQIATAALAALVFLLFALSPFALWFWTDAGSFRLSWYGWRETMQAEAARHPVKVSNVIPFLLFSFMTSPPVFLALPFAFVKEYRARKFSPILALAAAGLFSNLLLLLNYSTTVNWRYFLTGLPALAPLAASLLMSLAQARTRNHSRAFRLVLIALALTVPFTLFSLHSLRKGFVEKHAMMRDYRERLVLLPKDAVVIAGGQTVGVTYWRGVGLGDWDVIGTGAGWPGNSQLSPLIESYLTAGRRVFLDTDARLWAPCGWQLEETREIVKLESRFHFRRVSETIFEIRPVTDGAAQDAPRLERLLPENRPEEMKACAPAQ